MRISDPHLPSGGWRKDRFNRLRSHEYICSSHLVRGTSQYNVPGAIHECRTWSMIGAFDESRVTEIRIAMLLWVEDAAE
jgi:hypothetical protein